MSRLWAFGLAVLLLVSWRLWVPALAGTTPLPRIAWWSPAWDASVLGGVEVILAAVLMLSLVALGVGRWERLGWALVAATLGVLVLLDQHRTQPWAFQSLLYALLFATLPWRETRLWLMAITISIYGYSAAGKLDYQFVHTVGHDLIQAMARPLGGLSDAEATRAAFLLPLAELTLAVLLAWPLTRRAGGYAAVAMHAGLIAVLGPWSLDHSAGVLAWNLLLAAQALVLFARPPWLTRWLVGGPPSPRRLSNQPGEARSGGWAWPVRLLVAASLLAPLGERPGWWDHWTSWALYSPHNSRAEIEIHRSARDRLPPAYRRFLGPEVEGGWQPLEIERWSLSEQAVPVYPQARYQVALARKLALWFQLGPTIRVQAKGVSDRWTGKRQVEYLIGPRDLRRWLERYEFSGGPVPDRRD